MDTNYLISLREAPGLVHSGSEGAPMRGCWDRYCAAIIEVIVLAFVCGWPWFMRSSGTTLNLILSAGLAALLGLWGARLFLQGRMVWQKCPVTVCLGLLFLAGIWQLIVLPAPLFNAVAPATASLYEQMLPTQPEVVPSETPPSNTSCATISLDRYATRTRTMEVLAVFMLFAIVRNNIAPLQGLRRLGLCALANSVLLIVLPYSLSLFQPVGGDWYGKGALFDAFPTRENFACYLEVSLGLAIGTLLSQLRQTSLAFPPASPNANRTPFFMRCKCQLDPATLTIGVGVLILMAAVTYALEPRGHSGNGPCWFCLRFAHYGHISKAIRRSCGCTFFGHGPGNVDSLGFVGCSRGIVVAGSCICPKRIRLVGNRLRHLHSSIVEPGLFLGG